LLLLLHPGEFEKHAGCWMGWPYDKYLWREDVSVLRLELRPKCVQAYVSALPVTI
jgi:agmatine/peptidylarginine deiminase